MKKLFGAWCLFLLLFSCKTQETEKVRENVVVKSDKADVISYMIQDGNGVKHSFSIDNTKGTLTLSLPHDHNVTLNKVTPAIVISKDAIISPNSGTECDFSAGKTVSYTVTSEDGNTTKTYVASIKVLDARKNLEVESIKVYGSLVQNKKVTIDEKYSIVEKLNIEVKFKGENTPDFSVKPEALRLNAKADKGDVILSTHQTDIWNAWSETIEVTRGGNYTPLSNECSVISFVADGKSGVINEGMRTIHCVLPPNVSNKSVNPIIKCSPGAIISPSSGQNQDFSNGAISYTVTAENGSTKKIYSVTVESGKNNIAEITSFKIGNIGASIDQKLGKIRAVVDRTVLVNSIAPVITLSKGASVNPASEQLVDFTNSVNVPVRYTVTAEDGHTEKVYDVTITNKKSNKAEITSFKIGNVNATIVQDTGAGVGKITAEVEKSVDLKKIKPVIVASDGAIVSPQSEEEKDFSKSETTPVEYTVKSEDLSKTKKYLVTITHKKSNKAEITSFKIGNVEAVIDQNSNKMKAEVEKSVDLTKIKPLIVASEYAVVSPKSGDEKDFSNSENEPVRYTVTSEDLSKIKGYNVTITHKKSDEAEITSFMIGDAKGRINQDKTIDVLLKFGTDLKDIIPTIEISQYAKISPDHGTKQDFSNGKTVEYTVTSESGKVQNKYTVYVKKELPETRIKIFTEFYTPTGPGTGTIKIPKEKNEIKKGDIEITYEEGGQTITVPQDNYRIEGDQTNLAGDNGTMTLKIILNLGPEYLLNVPMIIEVSKKD